MVYGKQWKIDGVIAGSIDRYPGVNGRYTVLFERTCASIELIETIDWSHPTVERIGTGTTTALPEGYGFDVVNIEYLSAVKTYRVTLQVGEQYLGDVTEYQAQIAEKDETIAAQAAQLAELEAAYDND